MRKCTIAGVAVLAASALLVSALPQDATQARPSVRYCDRLLPLVGKLFYNAHDGFVRQHAKGDWKLVTVGVDFAEFHSKEGQFLVPLAMLRVTIEGS